MMGMCTWVCAHVHDGYVHMYMMGMCTWVCAHVHDGYVHMYMMGMCTWVCAHVHDGYVHNYAHIITEVTYHNITGFKGQVKISSNS